MSLNEKKKKRPFSQKKQTSTQNKRTKNSRKKLQYLRTLILFQTFFFVELVYFIKLTETTIHNLFIHYIRQPWCNPLWLTGLKTPTNIKSSKAAACQHVRETISKPANRDHWTHGDCPSTALQFDPLAHLVIFNCFVHNTLITGQLNKWIILGNAHQN